MAVKRAHIGAWVRDVAVVKLAHAITKSPFQRRVMGGEGVGVHLLEPVAVAEAQVP